ncbi:uncharacterized protein PpBr36_06367 [Pyricularia pennisetigena]|uniref:uncharacterized protein n=1 Tax=Pyricularia pennisetigena TaxID=1578925 RepID=UPI001151767B|nr:uncharacterized protein PpBr36_06367 [Pyricularia pennisetigena]TLS22977.1 hypothetical protein PpBr36_06367 [Pyricularia pennisetigena]
MPSHEEDDSKVPLVQGINIFLSIVTTLAVGGRVWLNLITLRTFRLDDELAKPICCAACFVELNQIHRSFWLWRGSPATHNQFAYPTLDTYIWSFVFSKMAFAVYFMRIFPQRIHKRVNMGLLVFLLMQGITETVVCQVMCVPRAKMFLPDSPGNCLDTIKFYYASFTLKFGSDIVLFVQPIPTLYRIRMAWPKKMGILLLLSLGLGLSLCALHHSRAIYFEYPIIRPNIFELILATDDLVDAMLWSEVEISVLIICVCVPEIHIIVQRAWPIAFMRSTTPRPAAGGDERDEGRSGDLGGLRRRDSKRTKIKTGQGSWYGSRSGASLGTWRRSRFGVISYVSAGGQSRHRLNRDEAEQASVQSLADEEPTPQSESPNHCGILVTREIEVGIETDEDHVSGTDVSDAERVAPEDEGNLTDSGNVDQDTRSTDTTNNASASDGDQPALETNE